VASCGATACADAVRVDVETGGVGANIAHRAFRVRDACVRHVSVAASHSVVREYGNHSHVGHLLSLGLECRHISACPSASEEEYHSRELLVLPELAVRVNIIHLEIRVVAVNVRRVVLLVQNPEGLLCRCDMCVNGFALLCAIAGRAYEQQCCENEYSFHHATNLIKVGEKFYICGRHRQSKTDMRYMKRLFEIMAMAAVGCWIAVGAAGCGKVEDPTGKPSGESQVDPNMDDPTKEYIASGYVFNHNIAQEVVDSYTIKEGNLCVFMVRKKNFLGGDYTPLKASALSVETSATVDGIVEVYVDTDEDGNGVIVVKGKSVGNTRITLTIKTNKTLLVRKFLNLTVTEAAKNPFEDDYTASDLSVVDCYYDTMAYSETKINVGEERRFCIKVFKDGSVDHQSDVFEFRVFFDEGYDSTVIQTYTVRDLDDDKAYYAFKGLKAGTTEIVFNAARQSDPNNIVIRRTFRFIVK